MGAATALQTGVRAGPPQQQVGRRDVAVHDALLVQRRHRAGDIGTPPDRVHRVHRTAGQQVGAGRPVVGEHLDRDVDVERLVVPPPHRREGPRTNL
jgi:hypothetical protein